MEICTAHTTAGALAAVSHAVVASRCGPPRLDQGIQRHVTAQPAQSWAVVRLRSQKGVHSFVPSARQCMCPPNALQLWLTRLINQWLHACMHGVFCSVDTHKQPTLGRQPHLIQLGSVLWPAPMHSQTILLPAGLHAGSAACWSAR